MKKILKEVQDGSFANEWMDENKKGRPNFDQMKERDASHQIEIVGKKLRDMMVWLKKK